VTRSVTAEQAQLARVAWVLRGGIKASGVQVTEATMRKLESAIQQFMADEGIFFDYQRRVDEEAAAIEKDNL
jgi:hypothetical protein